MLPLRPCSLLSRRMVDAEIDKREELFFEFVSGCACIQILLTFSYAFLSRWMKRRAVSVGETEATLVSM